MLSGSLITTLSKHVGLQADQEQVLCRELVCVCDELQSCCKHAASAVTVHPRVQTLLLTRPSVLLQAETTSEWMCGENIEQQMQQERRAILKLPFVSGISDASHGKRGGFCVNLRCHNAQEHRNCECGGLKQGVPVLVSSNELRFSSVCRRSTIRFCVRTARNVLQHPKHCKVREWRRFAGSLARRLAHNDVSLTGPAMSHEGDCGAQQYQAAR